MSRNEPSPKPPSVLLYLAILASVDWIAWLALTGAGASSGVGAAVVGALAGLALALGTILRRTTSSGDAPDDSRSSPAEFPEIQATETDGGA